MSFTCQLACQARDKLIEIAFFFLFPRSSLTPSNINKSPPHSLRRSTCWNTPVLFLNGYHKVNWHCGIHFEKGRISLSWYPLHILEWRYVTTSRPIKISLTTVGGNQTSLTHYLQLFNVFWEPTETILRSLGRMFLLGSRNIFTCMQVIGRLHRYDSIGLWYHLQQSNTERWKLGMWEGHLPIITRIFYDLPRHFRGGLSTTWFQWVS